MFTLGERRPVLFEIILIIVSFAVAGIITAVGNMLYIHPALTTSAGRIAVALVLLVIFRKALSGGSILANPLILLPALLFPVWNVFYNLSSGTSFGGMPFYVEGFITALAPALFEETIFRGIFISNLRKSGVGDLLCLLISSLLFAVMHLTNLVGQDLNTVLLQFAYSLVIGLVLAAIYLRNGSLWQIVALHFLIDFTNRIYLEPATTASYTQIAIFGVLLALEAAYAFKLVLGKRSGQTPAV